MKRFILAFIFIFLAVPKNSLAFETFTKSPLNPVKINPGNIGRNDYGVFQGSVLNEDGQIKIWYNSFNGIDFRVGYATSSDGISFTRKNIIDAASGYDTHNPKIFKTETGYDLYFASAQNFVYPKIFKISSGDGEHFDSSTLKSILEKTYNWETNGLYNPFVYIENGVYFLFYTGWQLNGGFFTGLATSVDGGNYTKCSANPILSNSDGAFLFKKDHMYYLFFHDPNRLGIRYVQSQSLNCQSSWSAPITVLTRGESYDSSHIISPSLLSVGNQTLLYYSGLNSNNRWAINLATTGPFNVPLPTAVPTPTQLPENFTTIVIPGLLASWNKDAILHNKPVTIFDWKLLPFVREYDGIIGSLKNTGQNFLVFPYDWRKSLNGSSDDLKTFLQENVWKNNPETKVKIIGHSLGGLLGRIFFQKYPEKVAGLVTVGSPHKGTANIYKLIEAGEIDKTNDITWLAEKLILASNKDEVETDKETIRTFLPAAFDLLPVFDFLKKPDGSFLPFAGLSVKNSLLELYDRTLSVILNFTKTFAGTWGNTLYGYVVGDRTPMDKLLGNYTDGRPVISFNELGDGIVLRNSAGIGESQTLDNFDHGQIISDKNSIKKIFNELGVNYSDNQIVSGRGTVVTPSVIFMMKSPAGMSVVDPAGNIFNETDGLIFIPGAIDGNYQLKITGMETGIYTLIIGKIGVTEDNWETYTGRTFQGKVDDYSISFTATNLGTTSFTWRQLLDDLINYCDSHNWQKLSDELKKPEPNLIPVHQQFFNLIRTDKNNFKVIMAGVEKLEKLYPLLPYHIENNNQTSDEINNRIKHIKNFISTFEDQLLQRKNNGEDVSFYIRVLVELKKRINPIPDNSMILKTINELYSLEH